jgi:hypothetical protein
MIIGMYVEQFCSLFCTAVAPDSEVLVHQMVAKELNSSDVCRLIPYTTVCGHATAARKHVAEDHPPPPQKNSVYWVRLDDTLEIVSQRVNNLYAILRKMRNCIRQYRDRYGMDPDQFEMYICRCELHTNMRNGRLTTRTACHCVCHHINMAANIAVIQMCVIF